MRLTRASCFAAVMALAGACAHNDVVDVISRDGSNTIPSIGLTPGAAGVPTGTRDVNRFISSGPFDTSVADAFGRTSTSPAMLGKDPNGFGYTTGTRPSIVFCPSGARNGLTDHYLPRLQSDSAATTTFYGSPQSVCYIVQASHPFNGPFWEFWTDVTHLSRSTRYVWGLARYAVQQRGALDIAEELLTGAVAQPDTLVFRSGDFNPAGYRSVTEYGATCPDTTTGSQNTYNAIAGANPYLLGSDVASAGSGSLEWDNTICRGSAWATGFGAANSPAPANNNTALGTTQYNFVVVWEANADSTPNYAKPVLRIQIGPLLDANNKVVNNGYGPLPAAQLTPLQLGGLKGATSRPDTLRLTFNTLAPLATGAYQVWLLRTDSAKSQLVTGRVVRLKNGVAVDTLNNVSEFNTGGVINGARAEFDVGNFPQGFWNAATLAVAGSTGNTTLPAAQPLWTVAVAKPSGLAASLTGTLAFGSFNAGTGTLVFGAAGSGTGGVFGRELREDLVRMQRPPKGYVYQGWLVNSSDTTKRLSLGGLLTPYPQLQSLDDADTRQTAPLSGVEVTDAAVRFVAPGIATFCGYDRMQIRLAPRNNTGALPPTTVLSQSSANKNMGVAGCP